MQLAFTYGLYALTLSLIIHLFAVYVFPQYGLLDKPAQYGLKRAALPYPTGSASVVAFSLLFAVSRTPLSLQDKGLLLSIALLALLTIIDDLKQIPALHRLMIQLLVGFLLFATGTRIYTITNPLGGIIKLDTIDVLTTTFGPLPLLSGAFTMFWVVLTTNAFNWLDGIPGQVSVLSFIGATTLGLLALSSRVDQPEIALIAFTLAGIALGSIVFDFPPNSVVMGDTGAMFFGLMLGALSIYAGGKVATAFLVLGVPLIDFALVTIRRIAQGRNPLQGGRDHLHHLLIDNRGWSEKQVIALTVLFGSAFGITALFLSTSEKFIAIILLALLLIALTQYAHSPSARHRR